VITSDLRLFHALPIAWIWHCLTCGHSELPRNIPKATVSHAIKKFKMLQQNGFQQSLKNFTMTGSENLFSTGGVTSNERGTIRKNEV
jgi:hypothetical protein